MALNVFRRLMPAEASFTALFCEQAACILQAAHALRTMIADDAGAGRLVAEIRTRDRAILERVQAITREETPYLPALRLSPSAENEDLAALLDEMEAARGDLVSLLINLSLKDWTRGAIDETGSEITLADEIEQHVEFDERQRRQLRESVSRS